MIMFNIKNIVNTFILKRSEFRVLPLKTVGNIPVFCKDDAYVSNYEQIASDHLSTHLVDGTNPFIDEETWLDFEQTTIDLILPHITQETRILDVGIGLGRVLSNLPECKKYGVDLSLDYLMLTQKKNISVCKANADSLPYRDSFFDIVVATDILEHVFDLNAVTHELYRVMKPGALLIVRVPYKEDLFPYVENSSYEYIHLRNFDEHSLDLHFNKIFNFEIDQKKFTSPKFRGSQSIKLKGIKKANEAAALIDNIPDSFGYTQNIKKALLVANDEETIHFMNALASVYPETFSELEEMMCLPSEINAVYKKPVI